jgi:hypothetical protein
VLEFIICRQCGRKDLERYLPWQPLILGPEYHRRSAVAYLLLQAITGDSRAGRKSVRNLTAPGFSSPIAAPGTASGADGRRY